MHFEDGLIDIDLGRRLKHWNEGQVFFKMLPPGKYLKAIKIVTFLSRNTNSRDIHPRLLGYDFGISLRPKRRTRIEKQRCIKPASQNYRAPAKSTIKNSEYVH